MKLWVHQSAATFGAMTRRPLRAIRRQITITGIFLNTAPFSEIDLRLFLHFDRRIILPKA